MKRIFFTAIIAWAAFCLLAIASPAQAQGAFGMHVASRHFPAQDYNNTNPGAYVRTDDGVTAGFYFNSERHWSVYAGYTYVLGTAAGWRADVTGGVITGYERARVLPLLVPSLATPSMDGYRARLAYIPKFEKNGSHVLHLMLERAF